MNLKDQMEEIYRQMPPEKIPCNIAQPPELIVDLVRSGRIKPCDAVDVGCGAGNYTVWLATEGFRMTGIDISPAALELAEKLAVNRGVECQFLEANMTDSVNQLCSAYLICPDSGFIIT